MHIVTNKVVTHSKGGEFHLIVLLHVSLQPDIKKIINLNTKIKPTNWILDTQPIISSIRYTHTLEKVKP